MEKPNDLNQNSLNMIQMSLNNSLSKGELFYNIIDFFSIPDRGICAGWDDDNG